MADDIYGDYTGDSTGGSDNTDTTGGNDTTTDRGAGTGTGGIINGVASSIMPASFTLIISFITSPHAGAPTMPVPTFGSFLSKVPTLRGFS